MAKSVQQRGMAVVLAACLVLQMGGGSNFSAFR